MTEVRVKRGRRRTGIEEREKTRESMVEALNQATGVGG